MRTILYSIVSKFIVIGTMSMTGSLSLNAWEISILNPTNLISEPTNILLNGSNTTIFKGYLESTGSILTSGSLSSYNSSANAIIINITASGSGKYTDSEVGIITSLLNSNTRVLMFGEHSSWTTVNNQLAGILGGSYPGGSGSGTQYISSDLFPEITDGVTTVAFSNPGLMLPGSNGISLTSGNSISLWGKNNNVLLFMDINILNNDMINASGTQNSQLAQNVANWLAGNSSNIPEPSTYGLVFGIATLGLIASRRSRK